MGRKPVLCGAVDAVLVFAVFAIVSLAAGGVRRRP
jgi:hypothetical protein